MPILILARIVRREGELAVGAALGASAGALRRTLLAESLIRAEVLTPDRLNTVLFGVFAAVALAIALVDIAGVLAFSVNARTREFGIRLALGSQPRYLLTGVIAEGAVMAAAAVVAGAVSGYTLARLAGSYFLVVQMPSAAPVVASALVLLAAAVVASALPARMAQL